VGAEIVAEARNHVAFASGECTKAGLGDLFGSFLAAFGVGRMAGNFVEFGFRGARAECANRMPWGFISSARPSRDKGQRLSSQRTWRCRGRPGNEAVEATMSTSPRRRAIIGGRKRRSSGGPQCS